MLIPVRRSRKPDELRWGHPHWCRDLGPGPRRAPCLRRQHATL